MAQRLQELCALLVEDTCGRLCYQIFNSLAEHGRLSRPQLQQLTRLPNRQLRTALAVLLQQHLILHYTIDDDLTFYQVDWRNAYYLLRSSRIVALTKDRFGVGAGKIITNLLQLGHASVGDLTDAFDLSSETKHEDGFESHEHVNGAARANGTALDETSASRIRTVATFHRTLHTLLHAGFLVKVSHRVYMPATDLQSEIEEAVISDHFPDRKVTGPKKQAEFRIAVNNLKRKWRDANEYSESRDSSMRGVGRRAGVPQSKRSKLNGTFTNGGIHEFGDDMDDGNIAKLSSDLVLQVNFARLTLALRSQRLEHFADTYLGGATSHVYGALLQVLETKVRDRDDNIKIEENAEDDEDDLPVATTMEVAEVLNPSLDLSLGILGSGEGAKMLNGDSKTKTKSKRLDPEFADIGIKQEEHSDDDEDHRTDGMSSYRDQHRHIAFVEEHLKLLEEHSKSFCRRIGGGGRGEWRVDFPALSNTLIQAEVDSTVLARFGRLHTRIIRLLRERGRLEEKQVASLSMMRTKDVRAVLTELQHAGMVEPQEVPRDASRQPQRTTYLWFHDQARVQSTLLQHTYQAITRTFQRLKQERETYKHVIAKAEMMDSKQEALLQGEKSDLMQWREMEEKLLTQVQKMDEMVVLLRDISGKDRSLVL